MRRLVRSYVAARDNNILHVEFPHEPEPPAPKFPGAGAMHQFRPDETEDETLALRAA